MKWGIEEMGETIYVGPMRRDGSKLAEIVFMVQMEGYTEEAKTKDRADCQFVVDCVNEVLARREEKL